VQVITSAGLTDQVLYPLASGVCVHRVVKSWGIGGLSAIVRVVRGLDCEALVIQYAPHSFDRRGITFGINLLPWLVRFRTSARIILNFHELYIPFDPSPKRCLGALWQRAMAFLMAAGSHTLAATSSEWPRRLRRVGVWKPIRVIPVGSNIPRASVSDEEIKAIRTRLGANGATLLVGCFGSAGPHRDVDLLRAAVRALGREQPCKLIWVGKSRADEPSSGQITRSFLDDGDIVWTGPLPHPEVSRIMTACHLFVLPFTDGVSTRRSTVAAALLHGLPLLTTRGKRLDEMFLHCENLYVVPVGDAHGFARGLLELARCPTLRARLAQCGRVLHDSRFAWGEIARQVAHHAGTRSRSTTLT